MEITKQIARAWRELPACNKQVSMTFSSELIVPCEWDLFPHFEGKLKKKPCHLFFTNILSLSDVLICVVALPVPRIAKKKQCVLKLENEVYIGEYSVLRVHPNI